MKKLLFLLFILPLTVLSQNKIIIKSSQVSISSLAPIAGTTVVANATGSPATPTAVPIGYGLRFFLGKLQQDTTIKDTLFAINGLSISGSDFRNIGLGGFLNQNTTISGSNAWALTLDSMQAATGRGFRVNFGSDAGYDLIVRDSATGFWTRVAKGAVGQSFQMLGAGGVGWAAQAGGSSGLSVTTAANTANYTVPTGRRIFVYLSDLTGQANRNVVLPAATTGDELIFTNLNTAASTFNWTFTSGTVKDYGQNTITTLTNLTVYHLVFGGTNYQIIN